MGKQLVSYLLSPFLFHGPRTRKTLQEERLTLLLGNCSVLLLLLGVVLVLWGYCLSPPNTRSLSASAARRPPPTTHALCLRHRCAGADANRLRKQTEDDFKSQSNE